MTLSRDNAIVWITGASTGLGRALALALAAEGRVVAASARSRDKLDALSAETEDLSGAIHAVPLDVTDRAATAAAVAGIEDRFGPIGLAVLNAGTHVPDGAQDFSANTVRAVMELNLFGAVNGLEALLPRMMARGQGQVALVASLAGYRGLPSAASYGASKAALINMAESLRPELNRCGVTLQVVNPGFVKTPLTDRNTFPMPFLMDVDTAASALMRGLASERFEIVFPRRFAYVMKALRVLPYSWFFAVARRLLPDEGEAET